MTFNPLRWNRDVQNLVAAISKYGIALVFSAMFYIDFVRPLALTIPQHGTDIINALDGISNKLDLVVNKLDSTNNEIVELREVVVDNNKLSEEHHKVASEMDVTVKKIVKTLEEAEANGKLEN
tara:strand:+ start:1358 stop:1726 length:369 start_codon:yes stop_codon:yes gene_type:complete